MNIVVVSHDSFWPLRGGGGIRVYWFVKKMCERGHMVTVVAPFLSTDGLRTEFPNIKIMDLGKISRFNKNKEAIYSKLALKMFFLILKEDPDLIYAHNIISAVPSLFNSKIKNIPLVFDIDDIIFGLSSNRIISLLGPNIEYFVARKSEAVICMSESLLELLESKGVVNIYQVSHGVNLDLFSPTNDGKKEDSIIYIGGIEPHDGVILIPEAAKLVLDTFPKVKFLILGNGKDLPLVKNKIKSLGIEKNFEFIDWIEHSHIPRILDKAKIGLVTHIKSLSTDIALVLKGFEYMSMKLPVIASDLRGMREEIGNNERGLLFQPNDPIDLANKILFLLSRPDLQDKMGTKGREFVLAHCNWDRNSDEGVKICENIFLQWRRKSRGLSHE